MSYTTITEIHPVFARTMFELPFCLLFLTVDDSNNNTISSEDQSCTLDGDDNSNIASDGGGNNKITASEHQSCRE